MFGRPPPARRVPGGGNRTGPAANLARIAPPTLHAVPAGVRHGRVHTYMNIKCHIAVAVNPAPPAADGDDFRQGGRSFFGKPLRGGLSSGFVPAADQRRQARPRPLPRNRPADAPVSSRDRRGAGRGKVRLPGPPGPSWSSGIRLLKPMEKKEEPSPINRARVRSTHPGCTR